MSRNLPLMLLLTTRFGGLLPAAADAAGTRQGQDPRVARKLARCNVSWDTPSEDSRGSMPLGNGDIGLNVWVEKDGDLLFYISKTDAWDDDVAGSYGLPKLGRVRIRLTPNPFAAGHRFRQTLHLNEGRIGSTPGRPPRRWRSGCGSTPTGR